MRKVFFAIVAATLTPLAAQAGEAFSVPPSGVLAPPKPVASLYDSDTITSGRPVAARSDIRPSTATNKAKPALRHTGPAIRSSLAPYVRHSRRPAATLPPGVVAPPPYRPGMTYQVPEPLAPEPAPTATYAPPAPALASAPAMRGFSAAPVARAPAPIPQGFSSLSGSDRRLVGRGLFTGSTASMPQQAYPAPMPQGQPIY